MSERARLRIAAVVCVVACALAIVGAVRADWWVFGGLLAVAVSQVIVIRSLWKGTR